MKKFKILSTLLLLVGLTSIVTTGFSVYKIESRHVSVSIPLNQIDVVNNQQTFFTFNQKSFDANKEKNLISYSNDTYKFITKDTFILPFSLNKIVYSSSQSAIANNSGLKIDITIKNLELYSYISEKLLFEHDFIKFKVGNAISSLKNNIFYAFKKSNAKVDCFSKDDASNKLIIRIPFRGNDSNLFLFQFDPNPKGNYNWNLDLLFDFNLIEEDEKFSSRFNLNHFKNGSESLVNFDLVVENY